MSDINDPNVVSGLYDNYNETQREILAIEIKKTRNKLFTIAIVILILDFLAMMMAYKGVESEMLLYIIIVPLIVVGLAFLAIKEPIVAIVITAIIIIGLWILAAVQTGGRAAITGWIGKAIIVYLLIAGFQSAREAQRIKKELGA